jgi:uncharacterized membrane protein YphA (DoxX/SURF4 family)
LGQARPSPASANKNSGAFCLSAVFPELQRYTTRTMDSLLKLGRCFFGGSILFFAIEYLVHGHYLGGLPPMPPWAPGGRVGAYVVGAILVAIAACIISGKYVRESSLALAVFFLLCVLVLHTQRLQSVLHNGNERTRALEPLAMAGAALVLSGYSKAVTAAGRVLFALTLLFFGWQHFIYAQFIATLIPAWMPGHLYLTYFTGAAFIAAGLAILSGLLARQGAMWLGIMFLLWVLTLHAPRVAAAMHNADEWTSAVVAVAMAGASWIVARQAKA